MIITMGGVNIMSDNNYGMAWSENYELGCDQVDSQHKRLFELVRDLVKACTEGYDTQVLNETITFLVQYTVLHFKDEEMFMINHNYPEYESHKLLHDDFKITVRNLVQEFNDTGSTSELSDNVNKVVVRWLINHIQREDKKIGNHVRNLTKLI